MSDESPTLADYSDYVEYEQRESGGVRGFAWPTDAEVIRCCPWAERFEGPGATLTVAEYAELGRATNDAMHAAELKLLREWRDIVHDWEHVQ
jgi:hypothetical protein